MTVGVAVISFALALTMKDSVWYASNVAFLIGTAAGEYGDETAVWLGRGKRRRTCIITLFVAFLCSGGVYTFYIDRSQAVYLAGKVIASAVWSLFLLCLFSKQEKTIELVVRIGAASMEVYLIHIFILQKLEILLGITGAEVVALSGILLSLILGRLLSGVFGGLRQLFQEK